MRESEVLPRASNVYIIITIDTEIESEIPFIDVVLAATLYPSSIAIFASDIIPLYVFSIFKPSLILIVEPVEDILNSYFIVTRDVTSVCVSSYTLHEANTSEDPYEATCNSFIFVTKRYFLARTL